MQLKKIFISLWCAWCFDDFFSDAAEIKTPRVFLPWFKDIHIEFTLEIIEGGCYTWSLSRDDVIDLNPLYEDSWGQCSRSAVISVSKTSVPPGSVIILAEEVYTGEILRGDVDVSEISSLKVDTSGKLYLEEAPQAFEVVAYDIQGNKFTTLQGITFTWRVKNLEENYTEEEPLAILVRHHNTDTVPTGVQEMEIESLNGRNIAFLYGQGKGYVVVTVFLDDIHTTIDLHVVARVVLMPASALVTLGDTLRYRIVKAQSGRLITEDIANTPYVLQVQNPHIVELEDNICTVKAINVGSTNVYLTSDISEVATATLTVKEPHSILIKLRTPSLLIREDVFEVHCILLDPNGYVLTAGDEILIRLSVDGEANIDLLSSNKNGTITEAVARNAGQFTITAKLHSVGGKDFPYKVEGHVSAEAADPLEVIPQEMFVAWTDVLQEVSLKHKGGGNEPVVWSSKTIHSSFSVSQEGLVTVRGEGELTVQVHLKNYPHYSASGKIWSAVPELIQVSTTGQARVGRPHHLHVALTAIHPVTGEYYNFDRCNCASYAVSLLEGPEPHNVTVAKITPEDGACCVIELWWSSRGVCVVRVSRARTGHTARVTVRAAPALLWPAQHVAALNGATIPVIAEGEALVPQSSNSRIVEVKDREGSLPDKYPYVQLFTLKCRGKGETHVDLDSVVDGEYESVQLKAACAQQVSKVILQTPKTHGNCSSNTKLWIRPGHEVNIKVTLIDAAGRELLDERGPKMSWETDPRHRGIKFTSDRLFVDIHPDFIPLTVPNGFYQKVSVTDDAIGWSGLFKTSIPDAKAGIEAKIVAPLTCDRPKVLLAWDGESVSNIALVHGGSGQYAVDAPKGVTAYVREGILSAVVPGPGVYDLQVNDLCVDGESQYVEVQIDEVLSIEVSTSRAVCVSSCIPISALVLGMSRKYVSTSKPIEWRVHGPGEVKNDQLCGVEEGTVILKAGYAGVWSGEVEVSVFAPLSIIPPRAQVPPGARLQLQHVGGPPHHLAAFQYRALTGPNHAEVSPSGSVHGVSIGKTRVRLIATDIANVEIASAESEVHVVPISNIEVHAATQTLVVGATGALWVEAGGLRAAALAALHPPPRLTWTLRDPALARIYTTHVDDMLERSVAEGLSIRVVPLKPGVITIDVRVRNMGQVADTRSWDSKIEILAISDIQTSVEGLPNNLDSGDRLALAVGANIRLKSLPRSNWVAYGDGAFNLTPNGEIKALKPGYGVVVAQHRDERNNIYREAAIHVEVSTPHYCTVEPVQDDEEATARLVVRSALGRPLLASHVELRPTHSHAAQLKRTNNVQGAELLLLDQTGAFMSFEATVGGVVVRDEVYVASSNSQAHRIIATGSWGICLEGVGWRGPSGIKMYEGSGVTLAVLTKDVSAKHVLKLDRPATTYTVHQIAVDKIEFLSGEWPSAMVPLSIEASGVNSGPLICSEDQRYALDGVQVELPITCRTKQPHTAHAVLDINNARIGCSVTPAGAITDASEVELCAEWSTLRTCTKVLILPPIDVSDTKVSFLYPPATFTVTGHPRALKLLKITTTPGLKLETTVRDAEIKVVVKSESSTCGTGYVNVVSKLTAQTIRVEVERECDTACGTLLGAIFSLIKPYLPTLMTMAAVAAAYMYLQSKMGQKIQIRMPVEPPQTVLQQTVLPQQETPIMMRTRTFSRSPYASNGPAGPIYGDASVLPDTSFSPNSTRMHSRFNQS